MKPGDFQLGLIEFLTVLLPGAAFTWLAWKLAGLNIAFAALVPGDPMAKWAAFGIVSLLAGQVLERIGALVCDEAFDALRRLLRKPGTPGGSGPAFAAMRAVRDEALRLGTVRGRPLTTPPADAAWAAALLAAGAEAPRLHGVEEPVNVFQFCCGVLRARAPLAWAEVERTQALSKLFRTLTIVALGLFACILLVPEAPTRSAAWRTFHPLLILLAAGGAFWCYFLLRVEAIKRANRFALIALVMPEKPGKPQAE